MKPLNYEVQAGIPALQQYHRDLNDCVPLKRATQRWMCPQCDEQHTNEPVFLLTYRCNCGWHGSRDELFQALGVDNVTD